MFKFLFSLTIFILLSAIVGTVYGVIGHALGMAERAAVVMGVVMGVLTASAMFFPGKDNSNVQKAPTSKRTDVVLAGAAAGAIVSSMGDDSAPKIVCKNDDEEGSDEISEGFDFSDI